MPAVVIDRAAQALAETHARRPAERPPDLRRVGVEVADVDALALRRERGQDVRARPRDLDHRLGQLEERRRLVAPEADDRAVASGKRCGRPYTWRVPA